MPSGYSVFSRSVMMAESALPTLASLAKNPFAEKRSPLNDQSTDLNRDFPTGHWFQPLSKSEPAQVSGTFVQASDLKHYLSSIQDDRVFLVIEEGSSPKTKGAPGKVDTQLAFHSALQANGHTTNLLRTAIASQNEQMARLLLLAGASLETSDDEDILLYEAVRCQNISLVKLLIAAGATLETGTGKKTLMQIAVEEQDLLMVRTLLAASAPLIVGIGTTPLLNVAFEAEQRELVKILLDAGASRTDVLPATCALPIDVGGAFKFSGIAAMGSKLYCAPYHAPEIMVHDSYTGRTYTIPTGEDICQFQWAGIAAAEGKLFCAPYNVGSPLRLSTSRCGLAACSPCTFAITDPKYTLHDSCARSLKMCLLSMEKLTA